MPRKADQENVTEMYHQYNIKANFTQKYDSKFKEIINKRYNNNLPLKKWFCSTWTEKGVKIIKEEELSIRSLEQKEEHTKNSVEINQTLQQIKNTKVEIIPGVIRHTSCPNIHLAFYLKYNK